MKVIVFESYKKQKWNFFALTTLRLIQVTLSRDLSVSSANTTVPIVSLQAGRTISKLLGVEADDLYKCFLKPKVKVGEEFVEKNMTAEQCTKLVGSAARTIYERVFKWLVAKCNTILKTDLERAFFIGVLDVPGFEIFDVRDFRRSIFFIIIF